jgi:hypothetical protein
MKQSKSTYALAGSAAMYFASSTYQALCLGTFPIHGVNILCNCVKLYSTEEISKLQLPFQHTLPLTYVKLTWSFPNSHHQYSVKL